MADETESTPAPVVESEKKAPPAPVATVYLLGASAHPRTRTLRRANRFADRMVRIGDNIVLRPNRRVQVSLEHIAPYYEQLVVAINNGSVLVQTDADTFVDPDELRGLLSSKGLFTGNVPIENPEEGKVNATPMPLAGEGEEASAPSSPATETSNGPAPLPPDWQKKLSRKELAEAAAARGIEADEGMSHRRLVQLLEQSQKD